MAKIAISDLCFVGSDLFQDSESFFNDLTDTEIKNTKGGITPLAIAVIAGAIVSTIID